jgi:Spy/CpxP family protein refolding chaperone
MKRFFRSILISLVMLFACANFAQADPLIAASTSPAIETQVDPIAQLKTKFLPQIQKILTPKQQEQLETALVDEKMGIRKAFKSLTLTPTQKNQIAQVFKSLPKKELFTSMTPAQKREFFMKKKEIFTPTSEEIAGYKLK